MELLSFPKAKTNWLFMRNILPKYQLTSLTQLTYESLQNANKLERIYTTEGLGVTFPAPEGSLQEGWRGIIYKSMEGQDKEEWTQTDRELD